MRQRARCTRRYGFDAESLHDSPIDVIEALEAILTRIPELVLSVVPPHFVGPSTKLSVMTGKGRPDSALVAAGTTFATASTAATDAISSPKVCRDELSLSKDVR